MRNLLIAFAVAVILFVFLLLSAVGWWGSEKNALVRKSEAVNESWGQVQNVYQRRIDLIPNLVATVKGYATHEEDTFVKVTQARSQVLQVKADQSTLANDANAQKQFMLAQSGLTSALSGMHVVLEKYPDLKANDNFRDLQSQLEGTENRITVARQNNQSAVNDFNTEAQGFLSSLVANHYGYTVKPYFTAAAGSDVAPAVNFNK